MIKIISSTSTKTVFVDTDAVPGRDSRIGDLVQNEVEGSLVHQIVNTFVQCGVRQDQMAVITPYRQQIKLLSHLLHKEEGYTDLEIMTADRSQGRDKECIIISMVRSSDDGQVSYFEPMSRKYPNTDATPVLCSWENLLKTGDA